MFIFSVLLFFVLVCAGAWLLLFPAGRELLTHAAANLGLRIGRGVRRDYRDSLQRAASAGHVTQSGLLRAWCWLRRHSLLALASAVLLTVPPLLAWVVSNPAMLGGFDDDDHPINTQVADLLKGEQLAPPAPLPPIAFVTTEVVRERPLLDSANRNWQLLDHDFAQRLLLVFKIMRDEHGYDMAILEGYRSPERQDMLAAQGSSVTNAKAFQSYHQYGLAADCAFLRDGKLVISEKDPWAMRGYQLYGQVAESAGLRWGGRWAMRDLGHTELHVAGVIKK